MYCLFKITLFCILIYLVVGDSAVADDVDPTCDANTKAPTQALRRKIFCNYDRTIRPVGLPSNTNATQLRIGIDIRFLAFYDDWQVLEVHNWMTLKWQDTHLGWIKSEYQEQADIVVNSDEIWLPDIEMFSSSEWHSGLGLKNIPCSLHFDGEIFCVNTAVMSSRCEPDVLRWPFDTTTCSVRFGSWGYFAEDLNITQLDVKKDANYQENLDWELLSLSSVVLLGDNTMKFTVEMKRHFGGHTATLVVPALVLAALTLVIFLLDVEGIPRLALICLSILCHCIFLQYLGKNLPSNGDNYPLILLFFRDSLLLASVSLIVTLVVRRLDAASSPPPVWITTLTDAVLATLPGRLFFSGEVENDKAGNGCSTGVSTGVSNGVSNNDAVSGQSAKRSWRLLAVLLDRITFLVFALTLTILLLAFLP